jgi:hypothetical protein
MTANKDLKRLVRSRMLKTGESYTSARAHLLSRRTPKPAAAAGSAVPGPRSPIPGPAPLPPATEFARLAGTSDAAIKAKTGCNWERWVWALDQVEAHTWPHGAIAKYVKEKYKIPGWWSQTVTVGYERIRGLREIGQRRGGNFEASRSRTFAVPVGRLFRAWKEPRLRARWLDGAKLAVRTATKDRSMRITWADGTSVQLWFTAKGKDKSSVAVQHTGLADRAALTRQQEYWAGRLDALSEALSPGARTAARKRG